MLLEMSNSIFYQSMSLLGPIPVLLSHHSNAYLIGLRHVGWYVRRGAVQILDTPLVVLAQLQWVGVAVEGRHHSIWLHRMLQAQDMSKLMSCHL